MIAAFEKLYSHTSFRILAVTFCLILSWLVVYVTGGTVDALPYIFFFSIGLSAWYWDLKAAVLVSFVSAILCGPFMYLNSWERITQPAATIIVRTIFFVAFAIGSGKVMDHMKEQNRRLKSAGTELIKSLAHTIELRDPYTNGHCERVAKMSVAIGRELGLSSSDLIYLEWSALIHDIGKIAIPESILNKAGRLTDDEYSVIKQHPHLGAWALRTTEFGQDLRPGVLHHHERWDGKGYPYGLSGDKIPLQARIIAVPDVWDALTSERSYRPGLTRKESLQIMKDGSGTQFDPKILDIFLELLERDFAGSYNHSTGLQEI